MTCQVNAEGKTRWRCDICGADWILRREAALCESQPIKQTTGVSIGTKVFVKRYQRIATVYKTEVLSWKYWGTAYGHTVALYASIDDDVGSCLLTYEEYEVIKPYTEEDTPVIQFERAVKI